MMHAVYRLALLVSACFQLAISNAQTLAPYSLQYQANANGISASATRSLQLQADQSYRLSNTLEARLGGQIVAGIEQVSVISNIDNELRPISYSYLQSGLSHETQAINYNWDALIAVSAEDNESWTIELLADTQDQLSHQLRLREELIAGTNNLAFPVIDKDEIEEHRYQLIGQELISTPLGNFNSTRVARIRADDEERSTVFWLANDWQFILIRMEQHIGGLRIVLELEGGTVDGTAIQSLN